MAGIELKKLTNACDFAETGSGRIYIGALEACLTQAGVVRETMVDETGLMFIRRKFNAGTHYFIANRGDARLNGYVRLAKPARSLAMLDPMTGQAGHGPVDREETPLQKSAAKVRLQLEPGESIILRCFTNIAQLSLQTLPESGKWWRPTRFETEVAGTWKVEFIEGGPQLPPPFQTPKLASWTELGGEDAGRFAGTARYSLTFDSPANANFRNCYLDLGKVSQSARIRLNGVDLGTLFIPPFRLPLYDLKPKSNLLEVEVTSVSANRIRDLDIRKVPWKTFYDINFVNLGYKPFDASAWPITDCGLLGPVKLIGRVRLWEDFEF